MSGRRVAFSLSAGDLLAWHKDGADLVLEPAEETPLHCPPGLFPDDVEAAALALAEKWQAANGGGQRGPMVGVDGVVRAFASNGRAIGLSAAGLLMTWWAAEGRQ